MSEERQIMSDARGVPVLSYLEGVREGRPWADKVEVLGPDPVDLIMSELSGWAVSAQVALSGELIARGARLLRHAHVMYCDLASVPPGEIAAPEGLRFVPCDRRPELVVPAHQAAYPPGHPDRHLPDEAEAAELASLLSGRMLGPVLPFSVLTVDSDDAVVGGVVVNAVGDCPAWVSEVFRHPADAPRGLGALMLRRAQLRAAAAGLATMGLAVTHGNPAKRVYERLGFVVEKTMMTVVI